MHVTEKGKKLSAWDGSAYLENAESAVEMTDFFFPNVFSFFWGVDLFNFLIFIATYLLSSGSHCEHFLCLGKCFQLSNTTV